MATSIVTGLKIGGYNTATGNPATGAGLLGQVTVNFLDDGSLTWTDGNSNKRVIDSNPQLNQLLKAILVGTNGISATRPWLTNK
jgi:hypothetical protein